MSSDFRTWENEVNRINKQIQRTARTFGYNSPEYQRYESMILSPKSFDQSGIMFKAEQGKPIRLLRTKSAYEASQVIPQYAKAIEKLGREKKVGEVKKKYISNYEQQHGVKLGREQREQVFKEMVEEINILQSTLNEHMQELYNLELKIGFELDVHQKLREISSGYWTSRSDKLKMLQMLRDGVQQELEEKRNMIADESLASFI